MRALSWRGVGTATALFFAASCGGSSTARAPGEDGATPGNGYPAAHPPFPAVTNLGGPTLSNPQLITVVFNGDTLAPQLNAFSDAIPTSTWWKQVSGDYGVGALTSAAHVTIMDPPPTQFTDSVSGGP